MALITCSECKNKISSNAAFCPHCGNPRDLQEEIKKESPKEVEKVEKVKEEKINECPNCGYNNKKEADFCGKCGTKLNLNAQRKIKCKNCDFENEEDVLYCKNCGRELKKQVSKRGWNFYNTFLTITFLISAIFGVMLFGSDRFREQFKLIDNIFIFSNEFLAALTISIGTIIIIVALIKDKFSFKKEIDHLKHFKLSKIQAAIVFIVAGILILSHVGISSRGSDIPFIIGLIFTASFIAMSMTTLVLNYNKIGWILDSLILLISIAFFTGAYFLYDEADSHMSWQDQLRSFYSGTNSTYDEYKTWGNVCLIMGIIFLILFIVLLIIRLVKRSKNNQNQYISE